MPSTGEIAPITLTDPQGRNDGSQPDEQPFEGLGRRRSRNLKPAFRKDGTVTAANSSSSISDGAAAHGA